MPTTVPSDQEKDGEESWERGCSGVYRMEKYVIYLIRFIFIPELRNEENFLCFLLVFLFCVLCVLFLFFLNEK